MLAANDQRALAPALPALVAASVAEARGDTLIPVLSVAEVPVMAAVPRARPDGVRAVATTQRKAEVAEEGSAAVITAAVNALYVSRATTGGSSVDEGMITTVAVPDSDCGSMSDVDFESGLGLVGDRQ